MMKSRKSGGSLISAILRSASPSRDGKSNDASSCTSGISGGGSVGQILQAPHLDLPGIHISRIETLDFDDSSLFSGSGQLAHFIIIHSDASSDFSRISFPNSECSLSGSSRSKSRSSRDSSNFSSRLWDFSPRESDWDVHVPQIPIPGGARDYSLLSPSMPRKGSVVTFDISEPTVRRHSSPASSIRRKDSIMGGECYCYCGKPDCPAMMRHGSTAGREPTNTWRDDRPGNNGRKKIPGDQSLMSITIDEDDGDEDEDDDETTPLRPKNQSAASTAVQTFGTSASGCEDRPPIENARIVYGGRPGVAERGGRPFLKRNNTDDSEVERRMAKIFHEINYSLTDSLEDSKYQSQEGVTKTEAETQTMTDPEVEFMSGNQSVNVERGIRNTFLLPVAITMTSTSDSATSPIAISISDCQDDPEMFPSQYCVSEGTQYGAPPQGTHFGTTSHGAQFGAPQDSDESKPSSKAQSSSTKTSRFSSLAAMIFSESKRKIESKGKGMKNKLQRVKAYL